MPNGLVRKLYDELGELLERGDDAFTDYGPRLAQRYFDKEGFLEGIDTERAEDSYTRTKVIREPGKHVIRFMEWPPRFELPPHEHHGRPCFEILVSGNLEVTDMLVSRSREREGEFELSELAFYSVTSGETAVVDPRLTQVHEVYSPVRSRSLHFYPSDEYHTIIYKKNGNGLYTRKRVELDY